jgi:hypothetical protein
LMTELKMTKVREELSFCLINYCYLDAAIPTDTYSMKIIESQIDNIIFSIDI